MKVSYSSFFLLCSALLTTLFILILSFGITTSKDSYTIDNLSFSRSNQCKPALEIDMDIVEQDFQKTSGHATNTLKATGLRNQRMRKKMSMRMKTIRKSRRSTRKSDNTYWITNN